MTLCVYCGKVPDVGHKIHKIPDILENTGNVFPSISCRKCGLEQGIICQKHELTHSSYGIGHACTVCINDSLAALSHYGYEVAYVIRESLFVKQVEDIEDWASAYIGSADIGPDDNIACVVVLCFYVYKSLYKDCPCSQLTIDTFESERGFIIRMMNSFYPVSAVA